MSESLFLSSSKGELQFHLPCGASNVRSAHGSPGDVHSRGRVLRKPSALQCPHSMTPPFSREHLLVLKFLTKWLVDVRK